MSHCRCRILSVLRSMVLRTTTAAELCGHLHSNSILINIPFYVDIRNTTKAVVVAMTERVSR
jgi:hypothetical protein